MSRLCGEFFPEWTGEEGNSRMVDCPRRASVLVIEGVGTETPQKKMTVTVGAFSRGPGFDLIRLA
jgi:hypothetical protein